MSTVQIAAIVLAIALALMLTTGALAYADRRGFALPTKRRRSGPGRPLRGLIGGLRPGAAVGRDVRTMATATRRATQAVAADLHAVRAAAGGLYGLVASEADALKAQLAARAVSKSDEATVNNEGGTVERLIAYLDHAKGERTPAPAGEAATTTSLSPTRERSLADDELEVLKAKLGKPLTAPNERRVDDVEALKAKLGAESATKHVETTTFHLKRKLAEPRAPGQAAAGDLEVASLKAKLKNPAEPATDVAVVDSAPAAQVDAVVPIELRSHSPRPARLGGRGQAVPPEQLRATKCRIVWWRGYVNSVFYAIARTAAGGEQVIAESPHFRWHRAEPPPQSPNALEAHRSLVEALERDGWSVAGTGDDWFAHRLERRQVPGLHRAPGSERG